MTEPDLENRYSKIVLQHIELSVDATKKDPVTAVFEVYCYFYIADKRYKVDTTIKLPAYKTWEEGEENPL